MARIFPYDPFIHASDLDVISKGAFELEVWERLSYIIAMQGRDFLGRDIESISVKLEEDELSVSSNIFRPKKLRFERLTVFDTENVHGLPFEEPKIDGFRVFDWCNVRSGGKHDLDNLESESEFVKKIHFFLSPRIDGNKYIKDLVAESLLSEEQIYDVDYSDSIARLKIINMMSNAGIKGSKNGIGKNLSLKIELTKREIHPIKKYSKDSYENVILDNRHYSEV
jgi:hypothetical protein|tara:strand:+ start:7853 stop:8527 length:675 start_codon:yes stop_codon:yes gene_type:complete